MNTIAPHDMAEAIRRRLDRPVVLVGMMGAGKTRLGRALATALDIGFVDSDEEIESAAGMTINEIFDRFGEPYFRTGEKRVVQRLLQDGPRIVSTGGGAMMAPETANAIRTQSISIWISAAIPIMVARATRGEKRPLLRQGDPHAVFEKLAAERYPVYQTADIAVRSDDDGAGVDALSQSLRGLHDFLTRGHADLTSAATAPHGYKS